MNESAISIVDVNKTFRKATVSHNYGTIKSALVNVFKGGAIRVAPPEAKFVVLNDVNLEIPKGETWGMIGKNGAGKSTLLKLIAGIYTPDSGVLTVRGKVSALIELGAGFHPDFSGRENVFINASILGFSKKDIQAKFDEIVAFAELEDFIDNPVRTYSSGMFMRLGFSIAVHVDPDVLLVDEVLAVGDEAFGHKCREKMEAFKKDGKTIILVSHSLGEIEKWCDGVVWIDDGGIREAGKPAKVIDAYLAKVADKENQAFKDEKDKDEDKDKNENANRWGDREVEITTVSMRDSSGEERFVYQTGDCLSVEVDYIAHKKKEEPVFGVAIYKSDGSLCYGTNTEIEKVAIKNIDGAGKIAIRFTTLNLVEGSYTVSVAVHAKDGHSYDYHDQMYEFSVRSKIKDDGVFRPPHEWIVGANGNGAK